jgi:hypothetical protein
MVFGGPNTASDPRFRYRSEPKQPSAAKSTATTSSTRPPTLADVADTPACVEDHGARALSNPQVAAGMIEKVRESVALRDMFPT